MTTEERLLRLENAFATLVELARNMDERMDDSNGRQSTLENNLTALSQIVIELGQAQRQMSERMDEFNVRQRDFDNNLVTLSQIVVELAQGQRRADEHAVRTDERLDRLAALFERHISEHGKS